MTGAGSGQEDCTGKLMLLWYNGAPHNIYRSHGNHGSVAGRLHCKAKLTRSQVYWMEGV